MRLVAVDKLDEIIKTARSSQYLLIMRDRFTKLAKSLPLKCFSTSKVSRTFVREWELVNCLPKKLLPGNGKWFSVKTFHNFCRILTIYNSLRRLTSHKLVHRLSNSIAPSKRIRKIILRTTQRTGIRIHHLKYTGKILSHTHRQRQHSSNLYFRDHCHY